MPLQWMHLGIGFVFCGAWALIALFVLRTRGSQLNDQRAETGPQLGKRIWHEAERHHQQGQAAEPIASRTQRDRVVRRGRVLGSHRH